MKIATQIHDQQTIVAAICKKPQDESAGRQYCSIDPALPWHTENGVLPAQFDEISM
jgi:hypothetical protein